MHKIPLMVHPQKGAPGENPGIRIILINNSGCRFSLRLKTRKQSLRSRHPHFIFFNKVRIRCRRQRASALYFPFQKMRIHRRKPMRVLTFLNTSWHFTGYEASLWEWQGAWAKKPIFGSAYAATRGMLLWRGGN